MSNWVEYSETILIDEFTTKILPDSYIQYFTLKEIQAYAHKRKKGSLAARYLIKNVIRKYFKSSIGYNEMEILNSDSGKPVLYCSKLEKEELERIHISLSHSQQEVAVFVIIEK
jgi:phosphopantetheinyl transferase (holo-ACP synthase)